MIKYLLILLLPFSLLASDPIGCAPEVKNTRGVFATVSTVKDGDWYDPSVWSNGKVPAVTDEITTSHNLTVNNRNIIHQGVWHRRKGTLTILNINESKFVGTSMQPADTDPGIWILGNGQLDWVGDKKTSWTNAIGSIVKGTTTIVVQDATGWNIGDEIVIVPTEKPGNNIDWNDATNQPIDPMIGKFERRNIARISGNQISFTSPLVYDHLSVTSPVAGKTWTAEVENLTRSIVTQGTAKGRSHIFIMSNKPHVVKYTEGRWLGPRIPGRRAGSLVTGRYGMHFHHCEFGSDGTIVEGNAFHDIGNRVYVPHVSHGITFRDNVAHDSQESPYFWDFQDVTHNLLYDHNIASLRRYNGEAGSVTGFELGQGDNIRVINNVAVYIHHGDPHQQGAFAWNTNNVAVIIFERNIAHSNTTGIFVWQNDNANHTIRDYTSYNNELGVHHGAYINEYNYINPIFYNSILSFEATQGNTNPMWTNVIADGAGKLPYLVEVLSSPVPAGQSNIFVNPVFAGYTKSAVLINTELFAGEIGRKVVDLVNPTAPNDNLFSFGANSIYNSMGRVQRPTGSYQITQSGRSNILPFAPIVYGKGTGLIGKYFNGANFEQPAFTRIDPMIKFQQWSVDEGASPTGVHYTIKTGGPYSIIWEGYYSPQVSGQTTFSFESFGGVRLWVDGRQILNRWTENEDRVKFDAPSVALTVGQRVKIRVEHFNTGGERGIQWYTKSGGQYYNVPISQLEPDLSVIPLPNRAPVVNAGVDITTKDTLFKIEGSANDPDNNLASVKWSGAGVELSQTLSDAAHVMVKGVPGVYVLKLTATDALGLTATDDVNVTILPTTKPPVDTVIVTPIKLLADAGADINSAGSIVELDGSKSIGARLVNWYHDSGPAGWNIVSQNTLKTTANRLAPGVHLFRLKITGVDGKTSTDFITVTIGVATFKNVARVDSVVCTSGSVINASVPAGKYTANTQALADALALQEINEQLSKCPVPLFTGELDGKKFYIFKEGEAYRLVVR